MPYSFGGHGKITTTSVNVGGNTFTVKQPTASVAKLNTRYNTVYIPQLKSAGKYDMDITKQLYAFDLKRVKAGKNPVSQTEFINNYHALHTGKGFVQEHSGGGGGIGGFFSNVISDVGSLASGLNPVKAVPALVHEAAALSELPKDIGHVHSLEDVLGLPGIRDIPGAWTAKNALTGNFNEMWTHPVSTVIDVLPAASKLTDTIAAERLAVLNNAKYADVAKTALGNLNSIRADIDNMRRTNPNFDLNHAWATKAKLKQAEDEYAKIQEEIRNIPAPHGSALEAAVQGKPLKALSRASGLSKAASEAGKLLGTDAAIRTTARMYALKMNGEGLVLKETRLKYNNLMKAETRLHDLLIYTKKEVKDWYHAPFAQKELLTAREQYTIARAQFRDAVRKEWIAYIAKNFGKTLGEEYRFRTDEYGHLIDATGSPVSLKTLQSSPAERGRYTTLEGFSQRWGLQPWDVKAIMKEMDVGEGQILIPSYMTKALNLLNPSEKGGVSRFFDKATDVFRYSVVMRPQHFLHILSSNMMSTLLERGITPFLHAREAFKMVHSGKFPEGMERLSSFTSASSKADVFISVAQGKMLGRLYHDAVKVPNAYRHFEEFINNMFRAMNFLDGAAKGISKQDLARLNADYRKWGITLSPEHLAGLEAVRKTTISLDTMSPMERTILRNVIPFYSYQRFLINFLTRFPSDHPFRAAMLATIGRHESNDWATGLPTKFLDLLPLGGMDANGDMLTIDTKNANPFRSLNGYNPFTVAGFLSSLNPAMQFPLTMAGVNVITATPELYPELKVDPRTGDLVATHPHVLGQLITTFLPSTSALDVLTDFSGQYKNLTGRAKLKAFLNAAGAPFVPQTINVFQERLRFAHQQFNVGQQEATRFLNSGDVSENDFSRLPIRGKYLSPEQLQNLLDQLKAARAQQGSDTKLTNYLGS